MTKFSSSSKRKRIWRAVSVGLLIFILCAFILNKFAYQIEEFNAKTRNFVRTGKFDIRYFDENGLPITVDARTGKEFISPFYVVHYALLHSELSKPSQGVMEHWREDSSVELWNVPPEKLSSAQFRKNVDWIVENARELNGKKHLIYQFDWRYLKYPNGGLKAPWWSGLTDGYALLAMLRAYDVFGDEKYLQTANALYESTIAPFSDGGSLIQLNGLPWIEEYVDPRAEPKEMSRVLNGMIYAYKGVKAYESRQKTAVPIASALRDSIIKNIDQFDAGRWSWYDAIGTAANMKYHRLHVALLDDPDFNENRIRKINARWKIGMNNPGFFWMLSPGWSFAKVHFLTLLFLLFGGIYFPLLIYLKKKEGPLS